MTERGHILATAPAHRPARQAWATFIRNRSAIAGLALTTLVLAATLIVPAFYPADPFDIVWRPLAPPGAAAAIPLRSDFLGRDVLAGILHGGRATLAVDAIAAAIAVLLDIAIGANRDFVVDAWCRRPCRGSRYSSPCCA